MEGLETSLNVIYKLFVTVNVIEGQAFETETILVERITVPDCLIVNVFETKVAGVSWQVVVSGQQVKHDIEHPKLLIETLL